MAQQLGIGQHCFASGPYIDRTPTDRPASESLGNGDTERGREPDADEDRRSLDVAKEWSEHEEHHPEQPERAPHGPEVAHHPDAVPGNVASPGRSDGLDATTKDDERHRPEPEHRERTAVFVDRRVLCGKQHRSERADSVGAEADAAEQAMATCVGCASGAGAVELHVCEHEGDRVEGDVAEEEGSAERRAVG